MRRAAKCSSAARKEQIRIAARSSLSLSGEVLRVHLGAVVSDEVSHCLGTDRDGLSFHAVRCRGCTSPLPSGEITRATLCFELLKQSSLRRRSRMLDLIL